MEQEALNEVGSGRAGEESVYEEGELTRKTFEKSHMEAYHWRSFQKYTYTHIKGA